MTPFTLRGKQRAVVPVTVYAQRDGGGHAFNGETGISRHAVVFFAPGGRGRAPATRRSGTGLGGPAPGA